MERYTVQSFIPPHAVHPHYRLYDEYLDRPVTAVEPYLNLEVAEREAAEWSREWAEHDA